MKNLLIFAAFLFIFSLLSSCNMYKAPCEGVSSIESPKFKI